MHRATPADSSIRGYVSGGTRGCVLEADDEKEMQELTCRFMKDEKRDRIEHPQNYGFTAYCRKFTEGGEGGGGGPAGGSDGNAAGEEEEKIKDCAEHFTQFMGGHRAFPVTEILDDRRYRIRNFKEGEVAIYDDQQQKLHIQRKRMYGRSPFMIEHRIIKDDPKKNGHGRDKCASRDQEKDKSIRLSTVVMDKDSIVMERTKEKKEEKKEQQQEQEEQQDQRYQQCGEDDEGDPEEKIQRCSQVRLTEKNVTLTVYNKEGKAHLIFDMDEDTQLIQMQTLREDRPHLQFTLDGENGTIEWGSEPQEGKPNLSFEMDDEHRKITIKTEKDDQPHLVFELDERNETTTWKTEQNGKERLKIELNDRKETITISTDSNTNMKFDNKEKKITLNTDNTKIEMDENAKKITLKGDNAYIKLDDNMARLGEENANIPAGMRGSIDTMGNRLIGALAKKVMVV